MNKGSQASPNLRCLSVLPQRRPGFQSRFGFGPLAPQTSQREGDFRETSPAFHSQGGLRLSPEERRTPLLGGHTSLPVTLTYWNWDLSLNPLAQALGCSVGNVILGEEDIYKQITWYETILQAELGLNEHHQNEVINYMRFARSKRGLRLKTVDSCFQDLKESRLVEETFTIDEVSEVLNGLQAVVHGEVESELINTAYTNVLLLRQLFSQAEKWYLKLQTDISELENRELLEQVAEFEKAEFISSNKKPIIDNIRPKLAPLNEGGAAELLNKEILRLQEENEKLKSRLKATETQATNALDEKSKLEKALQDLQLDQGNQKDFVKAQDLSDLENTVAALKSEFQKTLNDQTENQKSLEENLATAKHDLLRVQEQLSMAEKELEKKFQQTAAYRNMKEILTKKNDQIKDLRKRLAKYEPED